MTVDTDNKEFQDALNLIQYTRQSVFLTGKAGTGKSTFLRHICANTKKKYVVLAPTGIAAINAGGSPLRSVENMFEPPVGLDRFVAINPRNNRSIVKRRKRSVELQQPVLDFFGQRFGIFIGYVVKSAEYQPLVISICVLAATTYGLMEYQFYLKEEMSVNARKLTIRERYLSLLSEIPDILYRVPLKYITYYLGADVTSLGYLAGSCK